MKRQALFNVGVLLLVLLFILSACGSQKLLWTMMEEQ